MIYDAVVVGGGLSGLAAAVAVSARGGRVALLEQSLKLGGRCYSYTDPATGDEVDNGQHVLLGSYRNLLKYLDTIGASGLMKTQPSLELPFHHPDRGFATFRLPKLPVPLDLATGMLTYRLLSIREKRGLLAAGNWLRRWSPARERAISTESVDGWLDSLGQGRNTRECFWDPICVSVMNESPGTASALLFAKTIRAAFFKRGSDSRMLLPTVGQTAFYVDRAVEYLTSRKSVVRTKAGVARLLVRARDRTAIPVRMAAAGVVLNDGEEVRSGSVIAAVPHWSITPLLPPGSWADRVAGSVGSIGTSPIVSVHLWFDRPFMDGEMLGIIGKTIQWAFDRRRIVAGSQGDTPLITCVVSAARSLAAQPAGRIVDTAVSDLRSVYRRAEKASLVHSVVIKEKRATFSPVPGVEKLRPGPLTEIGGFYLAGDWTETGFPATIEGAVKSGFTAAECAGKGC